ncbi:hypothetical protein JTB14_031616 [Gonioctena quinquepunctata]|nr:hypothetical protein JTB14_031616 [Gonioctena quinquepunctata]
MDQDSTNRCSNCNGNHKSNYRGCPSYPKVNNNDGNNTRRPPRPPRTQEERNEGRNPGTSDTPLDQLLKALDELKEFLKKRPILANFVTIKSLQGAAQLSSPSV